MLTFLKGTEGLKLSHWLHPHACGRDNMGFAWNNKKHDAGETTSTSRVSGCCICHFPVRLVVRQWCACNPFTDLGEICTKGPSCKDAGTLFSLHCLRPPHVSAMAFGDSSDLQGREVNGGQFSLTTGYHKCNFCEFRLTMGGDTYLRWLVWRHILRALKLQPWVVLWNWRVCVFALSSLRAVQKGIFRELRVWN